MGINITGIGITTGAIGFRNRTIGKGPVVDPDTIIVSWTHPTQFNTRHEDVNGKIVNVTNPTFSNTAGAASLPIFNTKGEQAGIYIVDSTKYPTPRVTPANQSASNNNHNPSISGNYDYPSIYLDKFWATTGKIFESPLYFKFEQIAAGTYTIRIFVSSSSLVATPANRYINTFYEVNGVVKNLDFDTTNNTSHYVVLENVVVGSDGLLTFKLSNNGSMWSRPGMNLIEVIKGTVSPSHADFNRDFNIDFKIK